MSYIKSYPYDLFISYAHVDNTTEKGQATLGWITQFYHELGLLVDRNVGKTDLVSIWWDDLLRRNERFDNVIEEAIKGSAIFLSLTSNGYYQSDYCKKELKCFYDHAKGGETGLFVKNQSRLFHVQQYNFNHQTWLPEFKGMNTYNFFELMNNSDHLGYPVDTVSPAFKNGVKLLARNIYELLIELQAVTQEPPVSLASPSIFIGKVADTLYKTKVQLIRELEHLDIPVDGGDVPPPFPRGEHRKSVLQKVGNARLSVHIVDEVPGIAIEQDGMTYIQEQVALVQEAKKEQLIFIPKKMKMDEVDNARHRNFLKGLQDNKSDTDQYTLIRELSVSGILTEIQDRLKPPVLMEKLERGNSVFLDFHEVDTKLAIEMSTFFFRQNVNTFLCMNGTSPSDTMQTFESTLKEVNSVMIILGSVAADWVKERLNKAIETILREECPVTKLGIYVAPQVSYAGLQIKQRFLQVQFLDDSQSHSFNPATIMPFLKNN